VRATDSRSCFRVQALSLLPQVSAAGEPALSDRKQGEAPDTGGEAGASGSLGGTFDGEGSPSSNGLSLHHDSSFAILCSSVRLLSHARMFFLREDAVALGRGAALDDAFR
jgi:hypothetical protein